MKLWQIIKRTFRERFKISPIQWSINIVAFAHPHENAFIKKILDGQSSCRTIQHRLVKHFTMQFGCWCSPNLQTIVHFVTHWLPSDYHSFMYLYGSNYGHIDGEYFQMPYNLFESMSMFNWYSNSFRFSERFFVIEGGKQVKQMQFGFPLNWVWANLLCA